LGLFQSGHAYEEREGQGEGGIAPFGQSG
jgi:hypothetical protein